MGYAGTLWIEFTANFVPRNMVSIEISKTSLVYGPTHCFKDELRAILTNSWRQHPTRHQRYGPLPPIEKKSKSRTTSSNIHTATI